MSHEQECQASQPNGARRDCRRSPRSRDAWCPREYRRLARSQIPDKRQRHDATLPWCNTPRMADALATPLIPSLDAGARMKRIEFERRYRASPPRLKAELIEESGVRGVVHSRVFPELRLAVHSIIDGDMAAVLDEQRE